MKHRIINYAALVAALTLGFATSCEQTIIEIEPAESEQVSVPSVISASIPEEITKVGLTDEGVGNGMSLAWEEGDKLRVIATAGGSGNEQFSIQDGFTNHSASFSGTPVTGTAFTVFYPGTYDDVAAINARSYTDQTQIGNANTDHLEWNAIETELTDYGTVTFSSKQNGALRFKLQLPAAFTKVYKVALKAPSAIFSTTNAGDATTDELVLTLKTNAETPGITLGSDKVLTAYMMVSWNENVIAEGTELEIEVWGDQEDPWVKTKTVGTGGFTIAGGKVTNVKLNNSDWDEPLFWAGDGTESNPYQIKTLENLNNMRFATMNSNGLIPEGGDLVYFELIDDISVGSWYMVNTSVSNSYKFYFDGNNHTLSNFSCTATGASFFGYMDGCTVKDLVFDTVTLSNDVESDSKNGVATVSYNALNSTIDNVDVNNVSLTVTLGDNNNSQGTGAIVGRFDTNGTITGCDVKNLTITGSSPATRIGGVVGITSTPGTKSVSECTVTGITINASGCLFVGGIVGRNSAATGTSIQDCTVTQGSSPWTGINGSDYVGGIIGEGGGAVTIDNCDVVGNVACSTSANGVGGIAGVVNAGSTIQNGCSFTGSVSGEQNTGGILGHSNGANITIASATVSGTITGSYIRTGGIIGAHTETNTGLKITESSVLSGTVICGTQQIGGVIGRLEQVATISGNEIDAEITGEKYIGGIVGVCNGGTITSNKVAGYIHSSSTDAYVGGLVGIAQNSLVHNYSNNAVSAQIRGTKWTGGLIASITNTNASFTIEECAYIGPEVDAGYSIYGGGRTGGLVGDVNNASSKVTIKNCYTSGNQYNGGWSGGLVGYVIVGPTVSLQDCYSLMDIKNGKTNVVGGIIGGIGSGSAGAAAWQTEASNVTVSNCISWMNTLDYGASNDYYGAVLGGGSWKSTLSNNYRSPAMTVKNTSGAKTMTSDPNTSSSSPNTKNDHDGIEAGASDTISSVATALGWDGTSIWNLSGTTPTLRNLPE